MSATIGKISESLKNVLEANMTPQTKVTLLSPADRTSHLTRVNLFLYRVVKSPHLNNQDWLPKPGTVNQLVAPPLSLTLSYLMTAFSPVVPETGLAEEHGLMGEAMRVFYEHAILSSAFLEPGLKVGQVKISLLSLDVEELSKIWTALSKTYRLSAAYEVSFVEIPVKQESPMPARVLQTDLNVVATARMPAVVAMRPMSGRAGTVVEFRGSNLAGWQATVRIGAKAAATDLPLSDDQSFTITVPALDPGCYVVEGNIGNISRFRNTFQVTP